MWETHSNDYWVFSKMVDLFTHSLVLYLPRWRLSQISHPGDIQYVNFLPMCTSVSLIPVGCPLPHWHPPPPPTQPHPVANHSYFARDLTAAILLVKNKSISLLWDSCKFFGQNFYCIDPQHGRLVTWLQTKN